MQPNPKDGQGETKNPSNHDNNEARPNDKLEESNPPPGGNPQILQRHL